MLELDERNYDHVLIVSATDHGCIRLSDDDVSLTDPWGC